MICHIVSAKTSIEHKQKEIKRRVDKVRVYQKDEDGNVNEEIWIDLYVTNKLWLKPRTSRGMDDSTGVYAARWQC